MAGFFLTDWNGRARQGRATLFVRRSAVEMCAARTMPDLRPPWTLRPALAGDVMHRHLADGNSTGISCAAEPGLR
jgi:hypothetical protein